MGGALDGKRVLVVGRGSGIARAIADVALREGAEVIVAGRDPDGAGPLKGLGMFGFLEMLGFMAVFLVGFYYILRKGALKWED